MAVHSQFGSQVFIEKVHNALKVEMVRTFSMPTIVAVFKP